MMRNIVRTLNNSQNALLESPTGSGKSLALLCAVLAWREKEQQLATEDLLKKREEVKQETAEVIAELKAKAEQAKVVQDKAELDNILPETEILRVQKIVSEGLSKSLPVNTNNASLQSTTMTDVCPVGSANVASAVPAEISSTLMNIDTPSTPVNTPSTPISTEVSSAPIDNYIPIPRNPEHMPDTYLPPKREGTGKKSFNWKKYLPAGQREASEKNLDGGENDPSNWRKKFKYDNSGATIKIDEDSFEDFQAVKNEKPSMDQKDDMAYKTFKSVPRIFVGSRTHKQISQLISELKSKTRYNPRTTVLGSREQLCIHPKISKMANKTDGCMKLLDKSGCSFKNKTHSIVNHPTIKVINKVWDIEDIVKVGKKVKGCPYYASRKIYEGAEIVFCPYNYIIDPLIRGILDISLKGNIVILDEAHNIEDSSRDAGSFEVDEQMLRVVSKELNQIIVNGYETEAHGTLEMVVEQMFDWITSSENEFTIKEYETHHCNWTGQEILTKLAESSITAHTFDTVLRPAFKKAATHAENIRRDKEDPAEETNQEEVSDSQVKIFYRKCLSNSSLSILQGIFMVLGFLFRKDQNYAEDYQMILTKRIERAANVRATNNKRRKKNNAAMEPEWTYKLGFKCLNPGIIFKDMSETTRSVVLTSGTLSPLNTFQSELETSFEGRLEANHVIPKSQVWVGAIPRGPNGISLKGVYSSWESFQYQDDIGESLCNIVETVPFGVLCFLPSYNSIDKLMSRWKITGVYEKLSRKKMITCEPRGSNKKEFEETIGSFYKLIDDVSMGPDDLGRDGGLFFAVFRGKVSEGIDFTDNYCRAVVTIGIPYPSIKDIEVKFKKQYNDKKKCEAGRSDLLSGGDWYSSQAFRAINQALGRCIRHKNDWGAIILLEERFQNTKNVENLSKWVRGMLNVHHEFPEAIFDLASFVQRQQIRTASLNTSTTTPSLLETPPQESKMDVSENTYTADTAHYVQEIPTSETKDYNSLPGIKSELPSVSPFFPSEIPAMLPTSPLYSGHELMPEETTSKVYVSGVTLFDEPKITTPTTIQDVTSPYLSTDHIPKTYSQFPSNNVAEKMIPINRPQYTSSPPPNTEERYRFEEDNYNSFDGIAGGLSMENSFEEPIVIDTDEDEGEGEGNLLTEPKAMQNPFAENNIQQESEVTVAPVVFKPPEQSPVSLVRKDFFSIGRDDHSFVCITCICCGRILLEGPTRNILPITINDLALIAKNSNVDRKNIVEITEPSEWEVSVDLLGGPIDIKKWPNESSVTLNKEDGICYRSLQCSCPMSQSKGIIIRQSFGTRNSIYDGKVFLWLTQLRIQKDFQKISRSNLSYQPNDDFDMPSSQDSSMNDMFYNLT
ncbi:helicase C-terminal domain-containing protein [Helicostylum pulchrum]|nr:helicase C-terminal domain-containing protein [Helicostylum pulchrum]